MKQVSNCGNYTDALFIIGKQRSGTSWLGNILAEHPDIYGVRNPMRHGIWESLYFTHIAEDFWRVDTMSTAGFEKWCQYMANTSYVDHSNFEAEELSKLGPARFEELFRRLMDLASKKAGAEVWIEKSPPHTLVALRIAEYFEGAKFIVVWRELKPWLRSSVKHAIRRGRISADTKCARLWLISKLVVERWLYEGNAHVLKQKYPNRVLGVRYEELSADRDGVVREVLEFLGMKGNPRDLTSPFAPNTSFKDREARTEYDVVGDFEWEVAESIYSALVRLPVGATLPLTSFLMWIRDIRGRPKMDWFWTEEPSVNDAFRGSR